MALPVKEARSARTRRGMHVPTARRSGLASMSNGTGGHTEFGQAAHLRRPLRRDAPPQPWALYVEGRYVPDTRRRTNVSVE
jgi:hypothetical protein